MVGPQDTYEAGPNGNEVLGPNPGTNILTTNHIYIYTCTSVFLIYLYLNVYRYTYIYGRYIY